MVSIPTAIRKGVCAKWLLTCLFCCVVLFARRSQSLPVGREAFNERRSLLFFWRWGRPPSPSKSPPKLTDPPSTEQSYAQSRTSSQSDRKSVPVPETHKEESETDAESASSESPAFNPTSPTVSTSSWLQGFGTRPLGGDGSKSDPPASSSPSPASTGFQFFPSPSVKEAPETSPGSAKTKKEIGDLSVQEQLTGQIQASPSSSPSPVQSTTPDPSPSSPSPTGGTSFGALAKSVSEEAERQREQKANKTASPSPVPSPSPPQESVYWGTALAGALNSSSSSSSAQTEPSIPATPPIESPEVSPDESPEVTPTESPASVPSETPELTPEVTPESAPGETPEVTPESAPAETPEVTPEVTPESAPAESPEVTPEMTPAETPEDVPAEPSEMGAILCGVRPPIETPASTPSEGPTETPIDTPTMIPSESPASGPSQPPEAAFSESSELAPIEIPEAYYSEILEAVSSEVTEIPPTEMPEATSSETAEPLILEIPAMLSSIAEPSFVATPESEDLIPSIVPLLPPIEVSESGPDLSPIEASSEAPRSSLSVVVAPVTSPESSIPPKTPSAEPDVPPEPSIEALPPEEPTEITLDQISDQNPGVKVGVKTKEGKVGVLVPKGVTIALKNVVFEIEDDVDVGIAVEAGTVEFDQVTILIRSQSASSFHRPLQNTIPKAQKGLSLTNGAKTKISNSTFEGGTASMVDVKDGSQFHCFGCVFRDNKGEQGGAIRAEGSSVELESCSFENNRALSGGALYILGQYFGDKFTTLSITDSILTENKASREGGSLFVKNVDTCLIKNSEINDGLAGTQGGGLFVSSISNLQITGSEFTNNKAEASYGGAASLSFCSDIKLAETQFESNSANDGGALAVFEKYKASGKLEISKSTFESNEAKNRGGAIFIQTTNQGEIESSTDAYVTIDNSSFLHNIATDGGAIYAFSNSGESFNLNMGITKTNFIENRATKSGGGMYCGSQSVIHFENSVFQSNEAHTGRGCATYCGCSVSKEQTDSLLLQHVVEEGGGSQSACATGTVSTASVREPGTSNSKSNTLLYVFITLAVMAALVAVSIAVMFKHKRAMQSNGSHLLRRTLSSFTGPSRLHHIISVPFSDTAESQEDANSTTTALLRRVHDYGEMEHQVDALNADKSEVGSIHSHFITDEEERMAETIFADDAFAFDAFADDSNAPLLPTVSNLHQMTNERRQE